MSKDIEQLQNELDTGKKIIQILLVVSAASLIGVFIFSGQIGDYAGYVLLGSILFLYGSYKHNSDIKEKIDEKTEKNEIAKELSSSSDNSTISLIRGGRSPEQLVETSKLAAKEAANDKSIEFVSNGYLLMLDDKEINKSVDLVGTEEELLLDYRSTPVQYSQIEHFSLPDSRNIFFREIRNSLPETKESWGADGVAFIKTDSRTIFYYIPRNSAEIGEAIESRLDESARANQALVPVLPSNKSAKLTLPEVSSGKSDISLEGTSKGKSYGEFFEYTKEKSEYEGEIKEENLEIDISYIVIDDDIRILVEDPDGKIIEHRIRYDVVTEIGYMDDGFQIWSDIGRYKIKIGSNAISDYIDKVVQRVRSEMEENSDLTRSEETNGSPRERLEKVEELYEAGHISEEEYREKKDSIIEEI